MVRQKPPRSSLSENLLYFFTSIDPGRHAGGDPRHHCAAGDGPAPANIEQG
jgi:hypothetical protein